MKVWANHRFTWSYVVSSLSYSTPHRTLQKFKAVERCGVPQSDWVSGSVTTDHTAWASDGLIRETKTIG